MTAVVKSFIQKHKQLIEHNEFDLLYKLASEDLYLFRYISELTQVLTKSGVHVMEELTTVPPYYNYNTEDIVTLHIPANITKIDEGAFSACKNLESVTLSPNTKVIDYSAFSHTPSLKQIVIPNGVEEIAATAFYRSGLTEVTLPDSINSLHPQSFDEGVIFKCSPGSYAHDFARAEGILVELLY